MNSPGDEPSDGTDEQSSGDRADGPAESPADERDDPGDGSEESSHAPDGPSDRSNDWTEDSPGSGEWTEDSPGWTDQSGEGEHDSPGANASREVGQGRGSDDAIGYGQDGPAGESGTEDDGMSWKTFVYDIASSVLAVLLVGILLFATSGVWPPLVAVESPSMDPHMKKGDLVFVMEEHRFPGENAQGDTGVVTLRAASEDYRKFQKRGDVIVYKPNGDEDRVPIIHRAMFWVEKGERWYDEANREYVGSASSCKELAHCPAKRSGFITKGDNNPVYDQVRGLKPVEPEWVIGTAEVRIPALGWVRLRSSKGLTPATSAGTATNVTVGSTATNVTG